MKTQTKKLIYISILCSLAFIVLPLVLLFGKYSSGNLMAIPFGIGMCYSLLFSIYKKPNVLQLIWYGFILLLIVSLATMIFAGEGAICVFIMGLFIVIPYTIGIIVGNLIQKKIWAKNTLFLLIFATVISSSSIVTPYNKSTVVSDEIIVNTSSKKLWVQLTSPVSFGKSSNIYFRNGVSYPLNMHIVTINNNRYLNCTYNNGEIMAPITQYKEEKYFAFTFNDSLATMKEKNLYNQSQTMHIKNHFSIDYGKFELVEIDENRCKLIASTSFKHKFKPEFYTNFWVEYFVHHLHQHVLANIEKTSH